MDFQRKSNTSSGESKEVEAQMTSKSVKTLTLLSFQEANSVEVNSESEVNGKDQDAPLQMVWGRKESITSHHY